MYNGGHSAQSFAKMREYMVEQELQPKIQTQKMEEQTDILYDLEAVNRQSAELLAKSVSQTKQISRYTEIIAELSKVNAEHVAQIAKMTQKNQKSSTRQFLASIIVSIVAMFFGIASFVVSLFHFYKP